MKLIDLFAAVFIIAAGIGLIIVVFYTAAILAPILAVGFLVLLVYSFISDGQTVHQKRKKKKKYKRL